MQVITMIKGEERFVFTFDDESRSTMIRKVAEYAENPELSFDWNDAAIITQKIRDSYKQSEGAII